MLLYGSHRLSILLLAKGQHQFGLYAFFPSRSFFSQNIRLVQQMVQIISSICVGPIRMALMADGVIGTSRHNAVYSLSFGNEGTERSKFMIHPPKCVIFGHENKLSCSFSFFLREKKTHTGLSLSFVRVL